MKVSTLAVALFASTTLVSVTSAAVTGGVRGSIDQTQTRRSLYNYRESTGSTWWDSGRSNFWNFFGFGGNE